MANLSHDDNNPMPNRVKERYAVEPRKLPLGRWKGRVVRYDPENGKRFEMNRTFDTKKEAKNWAETEAATYRDDPNRKPLSEENLADYLNEWRLEPYAQNTAGLPRNGCAQYPSIGQYLAQKSPHRWRFNNSIPIWLKPGA